MAKGLTVISRRVTDTQAEQSRDGITVTTELNAIAFKAQTHPKHRFQNVYGLLNSDVLSQSWGQINKQSAAGIDGVKPSDVKQRLPENIDRLRNVVVGWY